MAFSTFRFFFETAGAPPPASPNTYYYDASTVLFDSPHTTYAAKSLYLISASSSTKCWALYADSSSNIWVDNITYQSAGPTVTTSTGTQLVANSSLSNVKQDTIGDAIDNTHFVNAYMNTSDFMVAQYITNSSGNTFTTTTTYTSTNNTGGAAGQTFMSYVTLDSTHGIIASIGQSAQVIEMINPVAGTMYTSGTAQWTSSTKSIWGFALSSTLAGHLFINSSTEIVISTIDIAGSSITINAGVAFTSSILIAITSFVGVCKISTTQLLLTYVKSDNSFGAVVATLAPGGSVTYNTEYNNTSIFSGTLLSFQGTTQPIALGSGQFMVNYINNDFTSGNTAQGGYGALGLLVTGTTITAGTATNYPAPFYNPQNFTNFNYNGLGVACNLTSSLSLFGYTEVVSGSGSFPAGNRIIRIIPINTGTSPSWSTWTGNGKVSSLTVLTPSTNVSIFSAGDELFTASSNGSGANQLQSIALDYATAFTDANHADTASSVTQTTNISLPPVDTSASGFRILYGYITGTTFDANIASYITAYTVHTPTTIDTSVSNIKPIFGILSNNTIIAFYVNAFGLMSTIITTNGTTGFSSTGTPTLIFSSASMTSCPINITVINSTTVLVNFQPNSTGTAHVMIVSVSGSTITHGTVANMPTNPISPVSSCLLTGSNGIMTYVNSSNNMVAVTYSFSGTTLTISGATAFTTSGTIQAANNPSGSLVAVDSTDAVCLFYDTTGTALIATQLNSTGEGNITPGTNYTISSSIASSNADFINLVPCTNTKVVGMVGSIADSTAYIVSLYRV